LGINDYRYRRILVGIFYFSVFFFLIKVKGAIEKIKLIDYFDNPNQNQYPQAIYFWGRKIPRKV